MVSLKPFRDAQKHLEGEEHVGASFVCPFVHQICKQLNVIANAPQQQGAQNLAKCSQKDFNSCWLKEDVAVFVPGENGKPRRGFRNRQVGIHPLLSVATFLDPRTKSLRSICDLESKE